jgi:hypothetical protein
MKGWGTVATVLQFEDANQVGDACMPMPPGRLRAPADGPA